MKFPNFKDRSFSNKVIIAVVLLHFISLMMAARFDQLSLNQVALYGTVILYLGLMPILWLWHRATKRPPAVDTLSDIRKSFDQTEWPPYDPYRYFAFQKGIFTGLDERRKPNYVSWEEFNTTHTQIVGTSDGDTDTLGNNRRRPATRHPCRRRG